VTLWPVIRERQSHHDIWVMDKTDSGWNAPDHLPAPVNSDADEFYPIALNNGATSIVLCRRRTVATQSRIPARLLIPQQVSTKPLLPTMNG
jgi:hypothetical protein